MSTFRPQLYIPSRVLRGPTLHRDTQVLDLVPACLSRVDLHDILVCTDPVKSATRIAQQAVYIKMVFEVSRKLENNRRADRLGVRIFFIIVTSVALNKMFSKTDRNSF